MIKEHLQPTQIPPVELKPERKSAPKVAEGKEADTAEFYMKRFKTFSMGETVFKEPAAPDTFHA